MIQAAPSHKQPCRQGTSTGIQYDGRTGFYVNYSNVGASNAAHSRLIHVVQEAISPPMTPPLEVGGHGGQVYVR